MNNPMFEWDRSSSERAKELALREAIRILEEQLATLEANNCLLAAASLSHALDALRSELKSLAG